MKLTDGKRTVEITIMMWEKDHYTPDSSIDFFDAGSLPFDADADAYVVKDVEYCIDQAHDWQKGIGDYYDDEWLAYQAERGIERCVFVTDEIAPPAINYKVDEYGRKHYPSGDYSEIDSFDDECIFDNDCTFSSSTVFGKECSFGDNCDFGIDCIFGDECVFGSRCDFGAGCKFGSCRFGEACSFRINSEFGDNCIFAVSCEFLSGCKFGEACRFESCSFDYDCTFGDECSFWDCSFGVDCSFGSECSYYDGCVFDK